MLFKQQSGKLEEIKEKRIKLEKNLQSIVENNLQRIFGLEFVDTEFQLNGLRIDTLAFNPETNAFVIIEYKRDRSFSIVDQGFSYLSLMLNNKAEFILRYQEKIGKKLRRDDISRAESRVLFLANSYSKHQKNAINFKDLPIELWEIQKFANDTYLFDRIQAQDKSESIKKISQSSQVREVTREVKTYEIDDHLKNKSEKIQALYEELSESIMALDERIEENVVKPYISYKINNSNVVVIKIRKNFIVFECLRVRPGDINDPEGRLKNKDYAMKHYNKHVSYFRVKNSDDIEYGLLLARQLLRKFFS